MRFTHESWDCVTESTIQNCWVHTGIVSGEVTGYVNDDQSQLNDLLQTIPSCCYVTAEDYINCDEQVITGEVISEDDIIEMLKGDECPSSEESEEEPPMISDEVAINAINTTIKYLDQPNTFDLNDDHQLKCDLTLLLTRFQRKIEVTKCKKIKQSLITDHFKK